MADVTLVLRRVTGRREHDDYDVFAGDSHVGRIYLVEFQDGRQSWFWNVSFDVTGRKSFGYEVSLEEAKAAFRTQCIPSKKLAPRARG
jgi:hypothetical protein